MSEQYGENEQTGQPGETPPGEQSTRWREDLERRAAEGDKRREEADRLRKENEALRRAALLRDLDIDGSKGTGKLFADAYSGELTEDAMRAAASSYDLLPQTTATPEQVAAQQQVAAVGQGSEHTSSGSDLQAEIAKLPKYGDPDWAQGRQKWHDLVRQHGGQVVRQRLNNPRMVNPETGQFVGTQETPITKITPPS